MHDTVDHFVIHVNMLLRWLHGLPTATYTHTDIPMNDDVALNLRTSLDDGQHSDVVLKTGNGMIRCHKIILAQYSTVFGRMLQSVLA